MKRKKYSSKLKAKVALAAIKGDQTTNEIASEFGIHVNQVNRWKKEALDHFSDLFEKQATAKMAKEAEKERETLYQQIGKLQVEVEWLKKNTGHLL